MKYWIITLVCVLLLVLIVFYFNLHNEKIEHFSNDGLLYESLSKEINEFNKSGMTSMDIKDKNITLDLLKVLEGIFTNDCFTYSNDEKTLHITKMTGSECGSTVGTTDTTVTGTGTGNGTGNGNGNTDNDHSQSHSHSQSYSQSQSHSHSQSQSHSHSHSQSHSQSLAQSATSTALNNNNKCISQYENPCGSGEYPVPFKGDDGCCHKNITNRFHKPNTCISDGSNSIYTYCGTDYQCASVLVNDNHFCNPDNTFIATDVDGCCDPLNLGKATNILDTNKLRILSCQQADAQTNQDIQSIEYGPKNYKFCFSGNNPPFTLNKYNSNNESMFTSPTQNSECVVTMAALGDDCIYGSKEVNDVPGKCCTKKNLMDYLGSSDIENNIKMLECGEHTNQDASTKYYKYCKTN